MNKPRLLWMRFIGEDLDKKSVPVYELAETLIAFQRIIHKVHLHRKERLIKGAHLTRGERLEVSLQIVERRKESDSWALLPFVTDPAIVSYVHDLVKAGLVELAKFALKKLFTKDAKTNRLVGSPVTGAIYGETVTITNHIYNIGKIERIEFGYDDTQTMRPVVLTGDTQEYVRSIKNKSYIGGRTTVEGVVTKLHLDRGIVELRVGPKHYVKVQANDENFRRVRYDTEEGDMLRFRGRPVFRLGRELYEEFLAEQYLGVSKKA